MYQHVNLRVREVWDARQDRRNLRARRTPHQALRDVLYGHFSTLGSRERRHGAFRQGVLAQASWLEPARFEGRNICTRLLVGAPRLLGQESWG